MNLETEEDPDAYNAVMNDVSSELDDIWGYLIDKYEIPDECLVSAFLDTAFDMAILDCGSAVGAVAGFQHALGNLTADGMAREMRLFRMRVN